MPLYNLTIDDISPFIEYEGTWIDTNQGDPLFERYLNTTFRATQTENSTASFSFNGTGVYLFGAKRGNHGLYSVLVDGGTPSTSNGSSTPDVFQTLLYGNHDLPYGEHRVILSNIGAPSWVDLDYIVITTGDGNSSTESQEITLDDTSAAFSYDDAWSAESDFASFYANATLHQTNTPNATATIRFHGYSMSLYGATSVNHGQFAVSLDGARPIILNGAAPVFRVNTLLYHFDGLDNSDHVVRVMNLGTTSDMFFDLDQVIISRYPDSSTASSFPTNTNEETSFEGHASRSGMIGGTVVGALAFVVLFALGFWWYVRRRSQGRWHIQDDDRDAPGLAAVGVSVMGVSPFLTVAPNSTTTHSHDQTWEYGEGVDVPPPAYDQLPSAIRNTGAFVENTISRRPVPVPMKTRPRFDSATSADTPMSLAPTSPGLAHGHVKQLPPTPSDQIGDMI